MAKIDYLRRQTNKRLLSYANNSKSPNYRLSVKILNERLARAQAQAEESNKKLALEFGYQEKVEEVTKPLTGKELQLEFMQIYDINKSIVKEYRQNVKGVQIILKGDDKHTAIVSEKYNYALQELMSAGYTKKEAEKILKDKGWTAKNMQFMAREIMRLNRYDVNYEMGEIIANALEGKLFLNTVTDITKRDTSEFR